MKKPICVLVAMAAATVLVWSSPVQGEDSARLEALERIVAEQATKIAELEKQRKAGEIDPNQREQIEKIVKEIQADAPAIKVGDWAENLDLFGDLRLRWRYRRDGRAHWNQALGLGARTDKPLSRGEFRLRLGAKKTWWDKQMEVAVRLDSSAAFAGGARTGDDVPFGGNGGVAAGQAILIGQAFAKFKPSAVPGLTVIAGKMPNPLTTIKTEMLWDDDFDPEGIAAVYMFPAMEKITPFVAAGAIQLTAAGGAQVQAYQGGVILAVDDDVKVIGIATYYDWRHVEGALAAAGIRGGNTTPVVGSAGELATQEFNVVNATVQAETKVADLPLAVFFDYALNCSDEHGSDDYAYSAGVKLGQAKKQGDWFVRYRYAYVCPDVFPDIVGDADFDGTDRKGHEVGFGYMISDFLQFQTELVCNKSLTTTPNPPVAGTTGRANRRLQLLFDLIWSW